MAYKRIYVIGDVQGCYTELQQLLNLIDFDATSDQLWFVGDLVNRGPQSLEVLRFIKDLGASAISVLGNHDLHLLAIATGTQPLHADDTLTAVLQAPDREALLTWLRHCPLLHHDLGYTLVHAGIPPQWSIAQAKAYAQELEIALRSNSIEFWRQIYGDDPSDWHADLTGMARLRYIVNALTRMRFCTSTGQLNLTVKKIALEGNTNLSPWFTIPTRQTINDKIIFGHWAALRGQTHIPNAIALDTGCVWGNSLTAIRLQDNRRFSVPAQHL